MAIDRHGSGAPWEPIVGYARVVRAGPHVWVSGCTAIAPDDAVIGDTPAEQMRQALANLANALAQVGAAPHDVVRTRMFVTDISRWEEVGRAHGEVFAGVRPATSMVEVSALIDPRMLVEIEADAFVADATTSS
jgi:enamine deaminase RidA (YjgF/YER057c/UK114 family)